MFMGVSLSNDLLLEGPSVQFKIFSNSTQSMSLMKGMFMNRRNMFALLGAGIVGGVPLADANAGVILNDALSRALIRAREIVSLSAQHKANPTAVPMMAISNGINALLDQAMTDFPATGEVIELAEVFKSRATGCFADADYANVRAELIPLKILRELMGTHKIGFRIREVPSFRTFTVRYRASLFERLSEPRPPHRVGSAMDVKEAHAVIEKYKYEPKVGRPSRELIEAKSVLGHSPALRHGGGDLPDGRNQ